MFTLSNMPSTTSVLSTYTAFAASAMLVRSVINEVQNIANQLLPEQLREKILEKLGSLMENSSSQLTLVFDEINGLTNNEMFEASEVYLKTKITPSITRIKVSKTPREKDFSLTINKGEKIIDIFEGIPFIWEMICTEEKKSTTDYEGSFTSEMVERRSIELKFHTKYREIGLNSYLPYVLERSKAIKEENKVVKLYSLGNFGGEYEGAWSSVNLEHPSTFDTLAMDPKLKRDLIEDLDRFVKRRKFYKQVGKAWKRGYLLYGPPGTGKSSLAAAMANYLKFHIYDLELTSLQHNSEFKRLLVSTKNKSILLIEDIDCSTEFQNRESGGTRKSESQLTLSGLLNFIDGLWSSCGDERIIVFTTNHKDRLDPALLRPGRMDMHIQMSYCTPQGFKILASNYLGISEHFMFLEIEKLITEVEVTPAEIAEELMKSEKAEKALLGLVEFLKVKKSRIVQAEEKEEDGAGEEAKESEDVDEETENIVRKCIKKIRI